MHGEVDIRGIQDGTHELLHLSLPADAARFHALQREHKATVIDNFLLQLRDVVKLEHPERTLSDADYQALITERIGAANPAELGKWVYYPWKNTLCHILDEEDFVRVRTVRNAYKITPEEISHLRSKKIGVIGLSVGQSVAVTAAMERIAGEIRIADFDHLELSNLNRLRTSLLHIGLPKTTVVYREIVEIDPYIHVVCFPEGIHESNVDQFLTDPDPLDLLFEECDSVDVKLLAREHARQHRIPVVMDTSDKGMIDVERFELQPEYPILHGLVPKDVTAAFLKSLKSSEEKLPYILPILGPDTMSNGLKASALEVGKSITTWPQLASDVTLGGALCTNVGRRILLGHTLNSGRYYVDMDAHIPSIDPAIPAQKVDTHDAYLDDAFVRRVIDELHLPALNDEVGQHLEVLVDAGTRASSPGNTQRWKWVYRDGRLYIFLDKKTRNGFSDNFDFGSLQGIGCAIENVVLKAEQLGLSAQPHYFTDQPELKLVCVLAFEKKAHTIDQEHLSHFIDQRACNRQNVAYAALDETDITSIHSVHIDAGVHFHLETDRDRIQALSKLICAGDRIRLTNLHGHADFFSHEIRWTREEAETTGDGLDITLFELTALDKAGLQLSKSEQAIRYLQKFHGGRGFERISEKALLSASAVGIVAIDRYHPQMLVDAGRYVERLWLNTTKLGLGFQPYTVLQMLFSRLHEDVTSYMSQHEVKEIQSLQKQFTELFPQLQHKPSVFLFRLTKSDQLVQSISFRKNLDEKLMTL